MAKRHRSFASVRSVVARVEELVLGSSGADAFELVFALSAAKLLKKKVALRSEPGVKRAVVGHVREAALCWPSLEVLPTVDVPDDVLIRVLALLDEANEGTHTRGEALDALFEQLVSRVGKGEKGQFFTPRHVVDVAVRLLAPKAGELVVDPACGSGAFLAHARAYPGVKTWGSDLDGRAVRVAKLLAIATGADPDAFVRADGLRKGGLVPARIDVVATNPPFAGEVNIEGYEMTRLVSRAERDALFLERSVLLLRPGGRLAIVLPNNKVSALAWSPLRRWLLTHARVFAVVSLPRETFLPHTSQRTVLLLAKRRAAPAKTPDRSERIFFAVSERAGKDASGEPAEHDLEEIVPPLTSFLAKEGFGS